MNHDAGHAFADDFRHCASMDACGSLRFAVRSAGAYHFPPLSPRILPTMTSHLTLARENMIEQQIRPWDVLDVRVLDSFRAVARDRFVPAAYREVAYSDVVIPLGDGEHMMKPVVEGRLLQALDLTGSENVLEIGTGSGYLAACLATLARTVTTVERNERLFTAARERLAGLSDTVTTVHADALAGFKPEQRFDAVVAGGAVDDIPRVFLDWLAPNGRLFIVRGRAPAMEAVLVTRVEGGSNRIDSLFETDLDYLHGAEPQARFTL
jgi:protein-L-isoaspartate(D-aspartate) O-methyltransferase